MVWLLGLDRLRVKVKAVVWSAVVLVVDSGLTTSSMESTAVASSFWIVPVPTALTIVALVAPDREIGRASCRERAEISEAGTATNKHVSPGAKVSVVLLWLM